MQRKQADRGIMDELRRVEELNKALVGADIPAMDNLKYAKNRSHQAQSLVEGQPRSQYATAMAEYDRSCFLNKNLGKRKPIFKNYIQNNTSIPETGGFTKPKVIHFFLSYSVSVPQITPTQLSNKLIALLETYLVIHAFVLLCICSAVLFT